MKIEIINHACMGCGTCKYHAPELIEQIKPYNKSSVLYQPATEQHEIQCKAAELNCPFKAFIIKLEK